MENEANHKYTTKTVRCSLATMFIHHNNINDHKSEQTYKQTCKINYCWCFNCKLIHFRDYFVCLFSIDFCLTFVILTLASTFFLFFSLHCGEKKKIPTAIAKFAEM